MAERIATGIADDVKECIDLCLECHSTATATVAYILERKLRADRLGTLLDAADMCRTTADFMLRGSELEERVCDVCSEVCEWAAQMCEQMGEDDQIRRCAAICRRCAKACREMAA